MSDHIVKGAGIVPYRISNTFWLSMYNIHQPQAK